MTAVTIASPELFAMLGASPILGRTFTAEEAASKAPVVVISHALWQRLFSGNPGVTGQALIVGSQNYAIIGVMPARFRFPEENPSLAWLPLDENPQIYGRNAKYYLAIARLNPGVPLEQAQAEMDAVGAGLARAYPSRYQWRYLKVVPLLDRYIGNHRQMLLSLLGAVGLLLLIACANIAGLFLARSTARQKEMAIRAALGASRGRLVRQTLTEGMIVAVAGGVAGLLMARWSLSSLMALVPQGLPRVDEVRIDGQALAFTLAATAVTGLLCGLAPALRTKDLQLNEALKQSGQGKQGGPARQRLYGASVVVQVALALVLSIGAGLMLKSFKTLLQREQGFNPERILAMNLILPVTVPNQGQQEMNKYNRMLDLVRSLPGVESAALTSAYPGNGSAVLRYPVSARSEAGEPQKEEVLTERHVISTDYFKTLKVPLLAGRLFDDTDSRTSQRVVVVNEELARQFWPGAEAVGRRLVLPYVPGDASDTTEVEVVGVVGNILTRGFQDTPAPELYVKYEQTLPYRPQLIVRTRTDSLSQVAAIRSQVREVDKTIILDNVTTLERRLSTLVQLPKFTTFLFSAFAGLSLLLVAVGVYGVLSYSVSRRKREIAVRMALGARAGDILKMVIGWGLLITAAGVAAGLAGALALTRFLRSQLSEVSATDPVTFVSISLLLLAVAFLACYMPARRATRVDPLVALRDE